MTPAAHATFIRRLRDRLRDDPEGLGLVGLGASSGQPPGPDELSGHQLLVVVRPGAQARWLEDLDWLPRDAGLPVHAFRASAFAVKVLFAGGHLVEVAVLAPEALALPRGVRHGLLLDKADLAARLAQAPEAGTEAGPPPGVAPVTWAAGQLLAALVTGAGHQARGEPAEADRLVRTVALGHLASILGTGTGTGADEPELAAELEAVRTAPLARAARALLVLLVRDRSGLVSPSALVAVRRVLERAEAA